MDALLHALRWFTGGDSQYMVLYQCMRRDYLWIGLTVVLDAAVAAGYALIAMHWWKNSKNLPDIPAKRALANMRNIFALSTVLEDHDMVIVSADNGRDAIRILQEQRDIDIVLMDIMMPEMDGIDTMREIRKVPHLKSLPIVAVTAKAMKGDREKCIDAGAWDYLSKPVDTEKLISVLRAWLCR